MQFFHCGVEYVVPDEWWTEAEMAAFEPSRRSFRAAGLKVFEIAISDVRPLRRKGSHGVFNDNPESGTAHDRVLKILHGFRQELAIPPVEAGDPRPMFSLPDGSYPRVTVEIERDHDAIDITSESPAGD